MQMLQVPQSLNLHYREGNCSVFFHSEALLIALSQTKKHISFMRIYITIRQQITCTIREQ